MTRTTFRGALIVATIWLGAIDARAALPVEDSYGGSVRYPYLCPVEEGQPAWPSDSCCDQAGIAGDCTAADGAAKTDRSNILLVVSDDQDYCLYGFMAGVCSRKDGGDFVSCLSEDACEAADGGRCVGSRDLGTCTVGGDICYTTGDCDAGTCDHNTPPSGSAAPPLRLNDLTCRNRQAKRPKKKYKGNDAFRWCSATDDYEQKKHHRQLEFSREGAPCRRGVDLQTPPDAYPVAFTPRLDELASHGAVFPRAYVAGTICKNSRRAMLHGRYLRHLQWLWENGGGSSECKRNVRADKRHGCQKELEEDACDPPDGENDGVCEQAHTIAWWLDSARSASVNLPDEDAGYMRYGLAKLDVMKPGRGGFASTKKGSKTGKGPGKIHCDDSDTECQAALLADDPATLTTDYPTVQVFDYPGRSHYNLTEAIDKTMDQDTLRVQTHPFFIWWGPHIPHDGPKADDFFWNYYDKLDDNDDKTSNVHREAWGHFARVSWFDASLGGVIYHLRRSCTCTGEDTAESLWKNTVVIFLSDQGWLLPGAKGNTRENTQRTPLIINTPEDRDDPAVVYEHEMASAVDLLPTILAYAGSTSGEAQFFPGTEGNGAEYPLGRNLKNWLEESDPDNWDRRRNLTFGEDLKSSGRGDKEPKTPSPRHIVTRPGLFGVCEYPYNFSDAADSGWTPSNTADCDDGTDECHVHPCLTTADCQDFGNGTKDLGYCVDSDDATTEEDNPDSRWNRCVNRPWVRCDEDSDCADPDWCPSATHECTFETTDASDRVGSYNDFTGVDCSENGEVDCLPPGVCKPLLLKVQWGSGSEEVPEAIWDLDWDPDQRTSLTTLEDSQSPPAYPYLANSQTTPLRKKLANCMKHFLSQDDGNYYAWNDADPTVSCPTDLIDWTVP